MANGEVSTLITVPMCGTGTGTIRLVEEVICARVLDGVHFDFDFTFIRPEAKPLIREIVDDVNRDAQRQVLVAGHTDRVGSNAYNQTLSESRARSVFGYVTNQANLWVELLRTMLNTGGGPRVARSGTGQSRDRWQIREIQYMLHYMHNETTGARYYEGAIDNILGPNTQAALDAFRADNGLPPGGAAGLPRWAGIDEDTWLAMFERYIALDALQVDTGRFLTPAMLGCGEHYPRIETRPAGTESEDRRDADARLETNRRVEFLLIPPPLVPTTLTCDNLYKNPDSPVVACPTNPQPITVTLHFTEGSSSRPIAGLQVQITGQGGYSLQRTTDEQGRIVLPDGDTTQGDYRVSAVGNYGLVLRDSSLGQVRGAEVLLHLTRSTVVEIMVTPVPARLDFVEVDAPDQQIDTLEEPDPGRMSPIQFKLAADIEGVEGETVTVNLASYLLRGPTSPVPGEGDGSGVVTPPTPLEFVDPSDVPATDLNVNQQFKLRMDSDQITGDTVLVMLSSRLVRPRS